MKNLFVWRGLRYGGFGIVEEAGESQHDGDRTLVPVRYRTGGHGIVMLAPVWKSIFGDMTLAPRELRPTNESCREAICNSSGMPEIIAVLSDSYKIGVNEGGTDMVVFVRKRPDSLVAEQVVALS